MEYQHDDPNVFELSIGNIKHRISTREETMEKCNSCKWQNSCNIEYPHIYECICYTGREKMATALELLRTKPKSRFPICYCKLCQGETQHPDCPNKPNPHALPDSTWFRALRGEPISVVGGR